MRTKKYCRHGKNEDVFDLIVFLNEEPRELKEIAGFLAQKKLIEAYENFDLEKKPKWQTYQFLNRFVKKKLGKESLKVIRKGGGRCKGERSVKYGLAITPEEALNLLSCPKKKKETIEEDVVREIKPVQQSEVVVNNPLEIIERVANFYKNSFAYSPREFEVLLNEVSSQELSTKMILESILETYKKSQERKVDEMASRYLS